MPLPTVCFAMPHDQAGAAYVVVGGIPELFAPRRRSSAQRLPRTPVETTTRSNLERSFNLSLSILDELEALSESSGIPLRVQIGVHCGEVVTGVVGSKVPRFCECHLGASSGESA